jgi:hypothetical protein
MARDYRAEYQARVARAQRLGFRSPREQRTGKRNPRTVDDYRSLPDAARDSRAAANAALMRSRGTGRALEETAVLEGVSVRDVRFWFPAAVGPTRRGRTRPTKADRYLRLRPIAADGDVRFVATRGSRMAEQAMAAFGTQWDVLHGRASADELERLRGLRIGGHRVETDVAALERLGLAGRFRIEEVYRELVT